MKKLIHERRILFTVKSIFPVFFFLLGFNVNAQQANTPGKISSAGPQKITTISVKTISGEVVDVKVPNDIRPGDQVTGTVTSLKHSTTLEGAVIEIEGKKTSLKDKLFSVLIPLSATAAVTFLIKDASGVTQATSTIPLNRPALPIPTGSTKPIDLSSVKNANTPSPGNFAPLNYCQPGQPLSIPGFFDGDASNTKCSISNIPCEIIAESPRVSFFQIPENTGPGRKSLEIEEGNTRESIQIQVVSVNLSANKTTLRKGEKTTISVTVSGLEGLKMEANKFSIELVNQTPANITFQDVAGNTITKMIVESDVKKGVYKFKTKVAGTQSGPFTLSADINSITCRECWKQYENCISGIEAEEKECYKDCEKSDGGTACYIGCSTAARAQEIECYAAYLGCVRKKLLF